MDDFEIQPVRTFTLPGAAWPALASHVSGGDGVLDAHRRQPLHGPHPEVFRRLTAARDLLAG